VLIYCGEQKGEEHKHGRKKINTLSQHSVFLPLSLFQPTKELRRYFIKYLTTCIHTHTREEERKRRKKKIKDTSFAFQKSRECYLTREKGERITVNY
jgi:hypothetical protein